MARCESSGNLHHIPALICGHKLESIAFTSKVESEFAEIR